MATLQERLFELGLSLPDILLPSDRVDLSRWPVIACDQFTSQPDYWERVERLVGGAPSTLEMILPEVYLGRADVAERIGAVHDAMRRRLSDGTLRPLRSAAVAVVRDTGRVSGRPGLLFALDLERYDYSPGSRSRVRATEQTIVERLPPRMQVRTGAPLELPHILVLIDDPDLSVIEPTVDAAMERDPLYSTELMFGGGRASGFEVPKELMESLFLPRLEALGSAGRLADRYGSAEAPLFVMGDGNHSLASAKGVWDQLKSEGADPDTHPARWALVEVLNLHSPQLPFEPIHRLLTGTTPEALFPFASSGFGAHIGPEVEFSRLSEQLSTVGTGETRESLFGVGSGDRWHLVRIPASEESLPVAQVQTLLDAFVGEQGDASLDFIHGAGALKELSSGADRAGIFLPPIDRSLLIPTVLQRGVLPRKAFSLGEAEEKRYYFEARRITPA